MRLIQTALTFDDVLLVPAFSQVLPRDTSLVTRLTRNISINIPLVSAAMDTVTESRLAIAMAQEGGIGIIHKNLTADEQAKEVARVKRHEFGIVIDPITVTPDMKVRDAIALQRQHGISGLPVVQGGKVVGIVTNRDLRFEDRLDDPISAVMTQQDRLITMREGATLAEAQTLMHKHRLERVLIVNDDGIDGPGIVLLEKIVSAFTDDIWVVAPDEERSGAGHSISTATPVRVKQRDERHFAVKGTPTDCALLAIYDLIEGKKPDILISGINRGPNLAEDMTYSGTASAAMAFTKVSSGSGRPVASIAAPPSSASSVL